MREPEAQRLARLHVPGGGPVRLLRVGSGLASGTYRAERDGASYSLRVTDVAARGGSFDAHWEHAVCELAGAARIGPEVMRADPAAGVLVCRWVEGRAWQGAAAAQPRKLAAIAALMRAIHALPQPHPARARSPADWIAHYERAIGSRPPILTQEPATLRTAAARRLETVAGFGRVAPALCHSDLHALNVVETDAGLVALDWEYAHVADPFWDPAGWSCANDFSAAQRRDLLRRYLQRAPSAEELARFAALVWLYDYVCLLWSEIYLREDAGASIRAARQRAARIEARLRAASGPTAGLAAN
ncbi:MAG TPA: hypothetical protein VND80_07020 [Steroidobacteraceae bacterium]|nr:hypothetical protein [Steroidobacteraceae bacterium]